ncbi:MAG: hypothetical protein GXP63_05290 [DPANN group archaeon]|nr:hypothetical protein [DPANN group archaeon]
MAVHPVEQRVKKTLRMLGLQKGDTLVVFDRLSFALLRRILNLPVTLTYHPLRSLDQKSLAPVCSLYRKRRTFLLLPLTIDALISRFFDRPFRRLSLCRNSHALYGSVTMDELRAYAKRHHVLFPALLKTEDPLGPLVKDFPSVRHAFGKALLHLDASLRK